MSPSDASINTDQPRWRVKVRATDGSIRWLESTAVTESDVIRRMTSLGWQVVAIESHLKLPASSNVRLPGRSRFSLILFSQELLALLDAGLNITEALTTLHAKERHGDVRELLSVVLVALREGRNFSDVLAQHPDSFPDVYVATVRASERTGDLPKSLARYIAYQMQFEAIRKKLVSAAIYPSMLLIVGGFVTLFLLGYVVPRFSSVYESSGREVPWLSEMLLKFGNLVYHNWQAAIMGFVIVLALMVWAVSQSAGRKWMLEKVLSLPWLKSKVHEFRMARFYRAVSLLLASGIALPKAMGMVSGLLSSEQQGAIAACKLSIEQGQPLSTALVSTGLATPVAESLIKVGERSGQMAEMLERTARFADDDFARWVDWASRLLEPLLMAAIGLVIGTVVVLMYMPIFELAGSLQ